MTDVTSSLPAGSTTDGPESGFSFTLDADARRRRKLANERRLQVVQLPVVRIVGFAALSGVALLHDLTVGVSLAASGLGALVAANLAYSAASWFILWRAHGRTGRIDLGLVFFHTDLAVWLLTVHHLEPGQLFYGFLLLVRVSDQVGFGFRRALYFNHVVVVAYLAYAAAVALAEPAVASWHERLYIAVMMYLIGLYLAYTGKVIEMLRKRTQAAVRAARELVDHLAHRTQELEAARREAEQAARAKSQFLAMIGHEIRTPMNGVLGATRLLLDTPLDPGQQRYADTARRSGEALLALIDDLLDLSRMDAGRFSLRPSVFDVGTVVDEALALLRPAALERALDLRGGAPGGLPRVVGDPARLRQVLLNLVGNAIKFTPSGHVTVELTVAEESAEALTLVFDVIDTGIGVTATQLDAIFQPFAQADVSSARRHGGSGLGLAIARQLAQLMGGDIAVESELGRGSTFRVRLPFGKAPGTAPAATATAPHAGAPSGVRASSSSPAGAALTGRLRGRVLLAEDNAVNQMVLEAMLDRLGCTVNVVADGAAAARAAEAGRHDLVLMDCHMPGVDGYEATRRIRADEARLGRPRLPIVAVTAAVLPEERARCAEVGMDDFLAKPVDLQCLQETLARWLPEEDDAALAQGAAAAPLLPAMDGGPAADGSHGSPP